jgi:hypothetical protein
MAISEILGMKTVKPPILMLVAEGELILDCLVLWVAARGNQAVLMFSAVFQTTFQFPHSESGNSFPHSTANTMVATLRSNDSFYQTQVFQSLFLSLSLRLLDCS